MADFKRRVRAEIDAYKAEQQAVRDQIEKVDAERGRLFLKVWIVVVFIVGVLGPLCLNAMIRAGYFKGEPGVPGPPGKCPPPQVQIIDGIGIKIH